MPLRTSLYRKEGSGRWPRRLSRRKEVLSVNMISLPLGDFRHLSHISSDSHGNSFGDLSFLREGHNLLLQSSQSEQNLFLSCPPPPKPPRLNLDGPQGQASPDWDDKRLTSAQRKKYSSLPLLDTEEDLEEGVSPPCSVTNDQHGSPGRGSLSSGRGSSQTCPEETQQSEIDSAFSFSLDLGPSILDDVLQVMDKLNSVQGSQ